MRYRKFIFNNRIEFYFRTAVMIPAPIIAPRPKNKRSKAMTFRNDACTCFFQTGYFSISGALVKGENPSFPSICFPIL